MFLAALSPKSPLTGKVTRDVLMIPPYYAAQFDGPALPQMLPLVQKTKSAAVALNAPVALIAPAPTAPPPGMEVLRLGRPWTIECDGHDFRIMRRSGGGWKLLEHQGVGCVSLAPKQLRVFFPAIHAMPFT